MKYFEKKIGINGAFAKYYLQEPNIEIDPERKYPTIVICPGGAFMWTSFREDEPIALRFLAEGFSVVVVHYATEGLSSFKSSNAEDIPQNPVTLFPNSLVELATAVAYLRENKEEWSIDENNVVVAGFSAGGNLAAQLGVYWHENWLEQKVGKDKEMYKPNQLMLAYAVLDFTLIPRTEREHSKNMATYAVTGEFNPDEEKLIKISPALNISENVPPTFLWTTVEDALVSVQNSIVFSQKLADKGIPFELHVFNKGKHGLGLGDLRTGIKKDQTNSQVYKWVDLFLEWLYPNKTNRGSYYEGIETKNP